MSKHKNANRWKEHHEFLDTQAKPNEETAATKAKTEICRLCGWSHATFYRKIANPASLSISEKITIANVYGMLPHFLFVDMEKGTV